MAAPIPAYDLGRVPYREALEFQHRAVDARAKGERGDAIYFVEHEPVLTVGRAGRTESLRVGEQELLRRGIHVVPVERGGDVTYHGPGQIVGYPIVSLLDLPSGRDVHRYLRDLEEALILALAAWNLRGVRRAPYTGVWVGDRKVAAIGVAVRRWVAFHGFALNVSSDLSHFDLIHPCGIQHLGVCSLETLLGESPAREEVLARIRDSLSQVWNRPVIETLYPEPIHA